jgi:hypothetical protein
MNKLNKSASKVMPSSLFNSIKSELIKLGLSVSHESITSHECEVKNGDFVVAYISRKVGITKGYLSVVIAPENISIIDSHISNLNDVSIKLNSKTKGRYISSSNYSGFDNKGTQTLLDSNEHVGGAYKLEISNSFSSVEQFFHSLFTAIAK